MSTLIRIVMLISLTSIVFGCALWEAGKKTIQTSYDLAVVKGEAKGLKLQRELLDEIEYLQSKIIDYNKKLQEKLSNNNPLDDERAIALIEPKIKKLSIKKQKMKEHIIKKAKEQKHDCRFKFGRLNCRRQE